MTTTHEGEAMGFIDKVKQKAEEYDLQGKAEQFADAVEKTTKDAVEKAGEVAHDNRGKVTSGLDKVGDRIDQRTDGKYHDKVAKAKNQVTKGVDKLAEQRADGATGKPAAGETPPAPPATPPVTPPVTPQDLPPTYPQGVPPQDRPL
jgi:hypothetical protein